MEPQKSSINVNLKDTTAVVCEKCGNQAFIEALLLRKVSKFLTGTANDAITPIATFACSKCGHVNSDLLPPGLNEIDNAGDLGSSK